MSLHRSARVRVAVTRDNGVFVGRALGLVQSWGGERIVVGIGLAVVKVLV